MAFNRAAAIQRFGQSLDQERARIRAAFLGRQESAHQTADALAIVMDETLQAIWHEIGTAHGVDLADHLALLAVGGYGRGQLAPQSDIDLLFLRVSKNRPLHDQVVEDLLYVLWDMRLKVGQAIRTPAECLYLGRADPTIATTLIDLRLIRGSRQGFQALRAAIDKQLLRPNQRAFVDAKMSEREARHNRQGQSRYILEPNVKEGKGGLRDLHALRWIARAVFGDGTPDTLVAHGVLTLAQARDYAAAEAFLLAVRLHLHYLSNRADEHLTFDKQIEIAEAMGFKDRGSERGVEAFMQAYFRAARRVGALTGIMIATIEEALAPARQVWWGWQPGKRHTDTLEGFGLKGNRLSINGAQQLAQKPLDFLRYFLVAHEQGLQHAPATLRLISQNLRLIDGKDAAANALFLKLLTHEKNPTLALRTMNETGVLAAFLPEWQPIVGRMQFNRYHSYTVDEHTLYAVDELHKLWAGQLGQDGTRPVQELIANHWKKEGQEATDIKRQLFVAMLYHDIAKGRPGRHEMVGADLAPNICARLGLSEEDAARIAWLIAEHLSLSDAAFQRDVEDPETLAPLAGSAESLTALRQLYCLTAADIRAVGPDVWSPWKGSLLYQGYQNAAHLLRGESESLDVAERASKARRAFAAALEGTEAAPLAAFLNAAPQGYWLAYDLADQQQHFTFMQAPPKLELAYEAERKAVRLTVCSHDEPGLFARLAGGSALAGWSVQATKAHTFRNGLALDTFFLVPLQITSAPSKTKMQTLEIYIEAALSGQTSLKEISARLPRTRTRRESVMDRPPTCQIYASEDRQQHTIIEVAGVDRPGLLFDLTATLMQLGTNLRTVRVATYGERFVNVFYVRDLMGKRLEGADRLARAKTALLRAASEGANL